MTLTGLRSALLAFCPRTLNGRGLPQGGVAYRQFSGGNAPDPPFVVYLCTGDDDVVADNSNYAGIAGIDVEYYTEYKDPEGEAALEAVLRDLGLVWARSEVYIESEKLFETVYSTQIVLTQPDESG